MDCNNNYCGDHLSGRAFDKMEVDENLKFITSDLKKNKQYNLFKTLQKLSLVTGLLIRPKVTCLIFDKVL